jgi:hypothetical protein
LKNRDVIIEKNKKLKQQKKPEEAVPVLDNLESEQVKDEDGNEVTQWYLLRNPQFKHLNLCLNNLDDEILPQVEEVLMASPDDFGFTLSGNRITEPRVKDIHRQVEALHKKRISEAKSSDPNTSTIEVVDIAQKRLAF